MHIFGLWLDLTRYTPNPAGRKNLAQHHQIKGFIGVVFCFFTAVKSRNVVFASSSRLIHYFNACLSAYARGHSRSRSIMARDDDETSWGKRGAVRASPRVI